MSCELQLQLQPNKSYRRSELTVSGVLENLWRCLSRKLMHLKISHWIWWEAGGNGWKSYPPDGTLETSVRRTFYLWPGKISELMQLTSEFGNAFHEMIRLIPKMSEIWTRNGHLFFQFMKDMNQSLKGTRIWNADSISGKPYKLVKQETINNDKWPITCKSRAFCLYSLFK